MDMRRATQYVVLLVIATVVLSGCTFVVQPEQEPAAGPVSAGALPTDPVEDQIANAMSAAPMAIAADATILGFPVEGEEMVLLREGTNGWTCIADWPASPSDDPMCLDAVWADWMDAFLAGEDPEVTAPGLSYMLQGADDTSNVDPFAPVPEAGEDWVTTPAHMMLLLPGNFDSEVFTTDHESGLPFIMWDETPYEHMMIPVVPAETDSPGHVMPTDSVDAQIANAMSAAPMAVAQDATILGFPTEGEELVLLREGTNGWTCLTDWPASPANDPMCLDAVWMAWQDAFLAGEEPNVTQPGLSYMLQGGDDTSNVDPFAAVPAEGDDWVTTPAHIMLLLPDNFDASVFTTDHASGFPYIMWDETPYEHLMIPVADMDME